MYYALLLLFFTFSQAHATPTIANEELTTLTDTTAIITWTTTNETADSKVFAGVGYPDPITPKYSSAESVIYHYAILTNLYPGTTYRYYISSGTANTSSSMKTFTTLTPPNGTYLFTFASMNDCQFADGKQDTSGARGRAYSKSKEITDAMVAEINKYSPSFTVIKGDIIEDSVIGGDLYGPYGDDVKNVETAPKYAGQESLKIKLFRLGTIYPIPGNHDKVSAYSAGNWVTSNLGYLYPAKVGVNPLTDSSFNYSFVNNGYRFIMLDSMRISDQTASVDAVYLGSELAAAQAAGQLCFIFTHHPVTNVRSEGIPDDVIKEVTGGTTDSDYAKIQIMNTVEVEALITNYKNIIAGVFSGHIHDNHYAEIAGVPCVRTSAGIQFPTTFNLYKVYSNGFMQSTFKVPYWSEIARNTVTPESGFSDNYWEQFGLGPNSTRNFVHLMSNLPASVLSSTPTAGETGVPLNESIRIVFSKSMSPTDTQNAFTISPTADPLSYSWENNNTVLVVNHAALTSGTVYTISIGAGAKDSTGTAIASAASSTFTAGTAADTTPPAASFNSLLNNVSTDNQPTLTGTATDLASAIVSIECRVDGGSFTAATPLDGSFNGKTETFSWIPPQSLSRGTASHEVAIRCRDAAGNINTTYITYNFYVIGNVPEIGLQSLNTTIINGDTIAKDPSFNVMVISNNPPVTGKSELQKKTDAQPAISSLTLTADTNNPYIYRGSYSPALADGTYTIRVSATDLLGNTSTKEVTDLSVQTNANLQIQGIPLNFPNPFNPENGATNLSYTLSKPSDISLTIHDLMGNQILRKSFTSGSDGGKAGYNEVSWNGRDSGGNMVGNGIYMYLIIGEGRLLSKGKVTVLK